MEQNPQALKFYQRLYQTANLKGDIQLRNFIKFHREVLEVYTHAISAMTSEKAAQTSSDGRSVAQVVDHIAEWDRFAIMATAEILSGVPFPQFMKSQGYLDLNGTLYNFDSVDQFNEYQAKVHANKPWTEIQALAVRSAEILFTLFTTPGLITSQLLDSTKMTACGFPGYDKFNLPVGWFLWCLILEHEGIEHFQDLGIRWD